MAELGWLGILVPERYDGLGLGLAEAAIVAKGLARSLAPEPLTAAAVLAATALAASENETLKAEQLQRLAAGEGLPALAWQEQAGALDPLVVEASATPFEGGYKLNGVKRFIAGAAQADAFLVSAQARNGIVLLWVPRDSAGVQVALEPLADGRSFGTLELADALAPKGCVLAAGPAAAEALARAFDHGAVVAGAELLGVGERALEITLDYLRTRVQFGKPIGAFQAIKHRCADMAVAAEGAFAQTCYAAVALRDGVTGAGTEAAVAKYHADVAAQLAASGAVQVHGAIGFTSEALPHRYVYRANLLRTLLSGRAELLDRVLDRPAEVT
jgi:alkylation response protein AidB-like acyl-CoA dehydrogenase